MSLDNYEIIKELGRGGMGAVFLANDKRLKRQVAIKVLKLVPNMDPAHKLKSINNFKREAVAIATFDHPNIVGVYDIGNSGDMHYIVMELIDGKPLTDILKIQGKMPFDMILQVGEEMCDALHFIHKNNVIHRDIKPENIIYTAKGVAKLTDFGISKFRGDDQVKVDREAGSIVGTIMYISPEQLQTPEEVDGRADMFSFGISLYELMTGKLPFDGQDAREVIMKILKDKPIVPSKMNSDILPHIDPVIMKALEKDPNKRYSNMNEFKEAIKSIRNFKSKFTIQPRKIEENDSVEKAFYSRVSIDSFEDLIKNKNLLPMEAQQSMIYEIDIMFTRYCDEYEVFKQNNQDNIDYQTFRAQDNLSHFGVDQKKTLKNFDYSLSLIIPSISSENVTSIPSQPSHVKLFLQQVNGSDSLKTIISKGYPDNSFMAISVLYNCVQKNLLNLQVQNKSPDINIFIGEMMQSFSLITKKQLEFTLQKQKSSLSKKLLGDLLVEQKYIQRPKLVEILKIQYWYKKLFI